METNVNYTLAGIFVLGLLTCIILGVIWLSAGFSPEEYTIYQVNMKESVSGLSIDAPVEFNGVNVGSVSSIKISNQNPQLVELLLKIKKETPISEGTKARLGMRALTGVAYILLTDKGDNKTPLLVRHGQQYPIISTEPSLLVRLDTTLTEIKDSFKQLSISFKSLLDEKNLHAIRATLRSTQKSMDMLQVETIPSATKTMTGLDKLSNHFSELLEEVKENPSILIRGKEQNTQKGPGE